MNQVATVDQNTSTALAPVRKPEVRVVSDPIAVLDTARFEHMQRIATVMAHSNLIPDALCFEKNDQDKKVPLELEMVRANCFLVVNQAVRWEMDPFAVAQCVSVVHGKLCYEGKLIAAVIKAKLGIDLEYEITGQGDSMKVVVTGTVNGKAVLDSKGRPKVAEGTVGEWKTTGAGSPWAARGGHPRMLRYRGAREWCRIHEPGLMLGVYSDDEMEDLNVTYRSQQARLVNEEPPAPPTAQVTHQPEEPATSAEELVTTAAPAETVEWSEPEPEEQLADEQPPVPPQANASTVQAAGGPGPVASDQHAEANTPATSDFPGDKPLTPSDQVRAANGDIPGFLKRADEGAKVEALDVEAALKALAEALTGVESTDDLAEVQTKYQQPLKGKVSKADWARSQTMVMEAFQRISEAE